MGEKLEEKENKWGSNDVCGDPVDTIANPMKELGEESIRARVEAPAVPGQ